MKKNVTIVLASMTIPLLLTGCGHISSDIGKEKATEIALEDAKLTESDVTRLHVSKDREDGQSTYEVSFTNNSNEYDYEILASNGEILSADYDKSDSPDLQTPNKQQNQNTQQDPDRQQNQNTQQNPDGQQSAENRQDSDIPQVQKEAQNLVRISLEEASALALEQVPGATAQDLKIELDYDDAYYKYEGDIIYDQKEYEFEIDANTGEFLEWKEERR